MTNKPAVTRKLPTIAELYKDTELAIKHSQLATLLNHEPDPKWIKQHPVYKTDYIPIERIEWLLTNIFTKWRVEVLNVVQMLNSAVVTVRLHYLDPITNTWEWQDGLGAHNFQLDQGANATEFEKLKSNAVKLAVPIAETEAVKDASDKLGKLFGKDLNRKTSTNYAGISDKFNNYKKIFDDGESSEQPTY